ncbi:unnamed protein product [Urochloa humidicola]
MALGHLFSWNNWIDLVLWGSRAIDFDAETVHSIGHESPVAGFFVVVLLNLYRITRERFLQMFRMVPSND